MRRDMDLVRKIALDLEDCETGYAKEPFSIEGSDDKVVGYHVLLMIEAGLVHGNEFTAMGDDTPHASPLRLTWKGHEFAAAARNETLWNRAKTALGSAGTAALPVWMKILAELAMRQAGVK